MIQVYVCGDCTKEVEFSEEAPPPCECGADKQAWMVTEKPEHRCGGESK